jgi:predicted MFS family arabinose efflux permease
MPAPEQQQPVASSAANGWIIVLLMSSATALALAFGRFGYGVLLPAVRDDMGISNTLAGAIAGANAAAYLGGTLLIAWLAGHYRLLSILRAGIALVVLGLLGAAMSTSPQMLMLSLGLAGLGGALVWIPAPVIAADSVAAEKRPLAVGLMSSGIGLGIAFVSTLGGSLRQSAGDAVWSEVYLTLCGVGLIMVALILLVVRHWQSAPIGGGGLGGFSALQRMPGWLPLIVAYACFGFMYLLVLGFLTSRLEDDSGWRLADTSLAFSVMGLSMIFGGPLFTSMAQRFGLALVLSLAFALWPVFTLVVLTGLKLPVLLACLGIGFLFSALPSLITLYVVENTTTQNYGPSFAAATLVFGLAQAVSPPIGGWIADVGGSFFMVFVLSAIVSVMGLLATLRLPRK